MRFARCYRAILWEPMISTTAKAVYGALKCYADDKKGKCWPSRPTLAKDLKCSVRTVGDALNELRYWGVVCWEKGFSGKANTYLFTDERAAAAIERGEGPKLPYDPLLELPPNENHSTSAAFEQPRKTA